MIGLERPITILHGRCIPEESIGCRLPCSSYVEQLCYYVVSCVFLTMQDSYVAVTGLVQSFRHVCLPMQDLCSNSGIPNI